MACLFAIFQNNLLIFTNLGHVTIDYILMKTSSNLMQLVQIIFTVLHFHCAQHRYRVRRT